MIECVRIHSYEAHSLVNGPGKRFVIWLKGCPFDCPGCFNDEARSFIGGRYISLHELEQRIVAADVHGVTLSGGEPFLQAHELVPLMRKCGRRGMDRMIYTGFNFNDLKRDAVPGARELLKETDLLLDGPYKKDIPPDGEWTGSGNQRVIALSRAGMEMKRIRRTEWVEQEYIIDPEGQTVRTGI
ncbi:MAG: 4Fe-4S single cluster domain-containing protein [Spirochaetales bacterium]|nr:4Fe-4S single cluster domain-containing protein [Spirochaetales bacterium]